VQAVVGGADPLVDVGLVRVMNGELSLVERLRGAVPKGNRLLVGLLRIAWC
jgi:hypothetical protein